MPHTLQTARGSYTKCNLLYRPLEHAYWNLKESSAEDYKGILGFVGTLVCKQCQTKKPPWQYFAMSVLGN